MQKLSNPPLCPVCKTPVPGVPVALATMSAEGALDGSALIYPALVCPQCGNLFCVELTA